MHRVLVLASVLVAFSCSTGSGNDPSVVSGTVLLLDQAPDIYGVLGDDGVNYEPRNLPSEYAVDGMRVRIDLRFLDGEGVWGKPIEIIDVDRLDLPAPGRDAQFEGAVTWVDLEGGFFGILGDDGTQYDPVNLSGEFAVDGLRVVVAARVRNDLASAHMWGLLISIENIDRAE